jgi:hypothetical protein
VIKKLRKNRKHLLSGQFITHHSSLFFIFAAMLNLSANFSARMRRLLGETDWRAFSDALQQPAPQASEAVSWCAWGKYLAQRPVFTLDPLLHAGAYYVQEAKPTVNKMLSLQDTTPPPTRPGWGCLYGAVY